MKYCKLRKIHFLSGVKLEETYSTPLVNDTMYIYLVGCLLYLNHTQLDIYYAVSVESRHMDQPRDIHWRETKIIFHFVQGTKTHMVPSMEVYDLYEENELETYMSREFPVLEGDEPQILTQEELDQGQEDHFLFNHGSTCTTSVFPKETEYV